MSACGDDSSKKGNGKFSYTGSKKDIKAAQGLVNEYEKSQVYFQKGYMPYGSVVENLASAKSFSFYARDYQSEPTSYYAMRHVGCMDSNGKTAFTEKDEHTQMDLVVGANSTRAVYVQQNNIGRCHLGQISINGFYELNNILKGSLNKIKEVGKLPKDSCIDYDIKAAYTRIEKQHIRDLKDHRDNYWRREDYIEHDSYYDVFNNRFSQFNAYNNHGSSENDSFGTIAHGEAVFVSSKVRDSSSNPTCVKDVYWGFEIDSTQPPRIQILGRNK